MPHRCIFVAALCMLSPASVPIMLTTFETVALAAVVTVSAMLFKLRLREYWSSLTSLCLTTDEHEKDDERA